MKTPDWLKEIDAREKAASKGPWAWDDKGRSAEGLRTMMLNIARGPAGETLLYHSACWKVHKRNMAFIAHSRTDAPLMRDMLRLLAEELGATACELARIRYLLVGEDQDEVGRRWAAVEAALAHYHDGTLPEKGESDEQETG